MVDMVTSLDPRLCLAISSPGNYPQHLPFITISSSFTFERPPSKRSRPCNEPERDGTELRLLCRPDVTSPTLFFIFEIVSAPNQP